MDRRCGLCKKPKPEEAFHVLARGERKGERAKVCIECNTRYVWGKQKKVPKPERSRSPFAWNGRQPAAPVTSPLLNRPASHEKNRKDVERHLREFHAKGGKVRVIPSGVSGLKA